MTNKRFLRSISVFLATLMLLTGTSFFDAKAVEYTASQISFTEEEQALEDFKKEYVIISENQNGEGTMLISSTPVRYQKENGKWVNIENNIEFSLLGFFKGYRYKNKAGATDIYFAGNTEKGNLVKLQKDKYSVAFRQKDNVGTSKKISPYAITESGIKDTVTYKDVLGSGVDATFSANNDSLMYEFILNESSEHCISTELCVENAVPDVQRNGSILLKDNKTGKTVGVLSAPVAEDSSEGMNDLGTVLVSIKHIEGDRYNYTIQLDETSLQDTEIVYPIVLAASASSKTSNSSGDAFVTKKYPTVNHGADTQVKIGNSGTWGVSRGLFQFSSIYTLLGSNKAITSAVFVAYQDYSGSSSPTMQLYRASAGFNEGSVTWNNQPGMASLIGSQVVNSVKAYTWNITSAAKYWYQNRTATCAMVLKNDNESLNMYKRFKAKEGGSNAPYIKITYTTAVPTVSGISVSPANWTKGSITVSHASVTSAAGGTITYQYAVTSNTTAPAGSAYRDLPANKKINPADGTGYVWVRAKDSNGNYGGGGRSSNMYKRDTAAPTMPASVTVSPSGWTNGNITVQHSASTDATSGIAKYQYAVSTSNTTAPTAFVDLPSPNATSHSVALEAGSKYVWVRAVDNAGNISAAKCSSAVYKRDITAPAAPSNITVSPTDWGNGDITITHSAVSDTSGIAKYQYAISVSNTTAPTSGFRDFAEPTATTHSITASTVGINYIWVRAVDNAGNIGASACSPAPYQYDNISPTIDLEHLHFIKSRNQLTITWSDIIEEQSGIQKLQYRIGDGEYTDIPNSNSVSGEYSFTFTGNASSVIYLRIIDNANNISAEYTKEIETQFRAVATQHDDNALLITWDAQTLATSYAVYRSDSINGTYALLIDEITESYLIDTTAVPGSTYYYKVVVKFPLGITDESTIANITNTGVYADTQTYGAKAYQEYPTVNCAGGNFEIDPFTKNISYASADANSNSAILNLSFGRKYNSQNSKDGVLGIGWSVSGIVSLYPKFENGEELGVVLKETDGTTYFFTKTDNGYTAPLGLYATLSANSVANGYILTYPSGITYWFNKSNQIQGITTPEGNYIEYSYDENARLIQIKNNQNETLTISYDEGRISSVQTAGKTYGYEYVNGMLSRYYQLVGEQQSNIAVYGYENSILTSVTDAEGNVYSLEYDENGNLISVTDPVESASTISYEDNSVSVVKDGIATIYQYSTAKTLTSKTVNSRTTSYTYDNNFNITQIAYPNNTAEQYAYDENGNQTTYTNKLGKVTTTVYQNNLPVTVTEPFNGEDTKVTKNAYNSYNQLVSSYIEGINKKTFYYYDAGHYGVKTKEIILIGPNATEKNNEEAIALIGNTSYYVAVTDYEYDSYGRLIKTIRRGDVDRISTQTYELSNQVATEVSGTTSTSYAYDENGNVTQTTTTVQDNSGNVVTTQNTSFDKLGNETSYTDENGTTTSAEYDGISRVTGTTEAEGVTSSTEYFANADGTSYTVETFKKNNVITRKTISVKDQWGNELLSGYIKLFNTNNALLSPKTYAGYELLSYTEKTYDVMNRCLTSTNESGIITLYTYDANDQVLTETIKKGNRSQVTTYTYDDAGNRLSVTEPDGTTKSSIYDKEGRLLSESTTKGQNSLVVNAFIYDEVVNGQLRTTAIDANNRNRYYFANTFGEVIKETNATASTVYTYDSEGRLISSVLTDTDYTGQSASTTYQYIGKNVSKKNYSDTHWVEYTYDSAGNVISESVTRDNGASFIITTHSYDDAGREIQTVRDGETVSRTYDDMGNDLSVTAAGRTVYYEYDEAGKVTAVKEGNSLIREYFYTNGQLLTIRDYRTDTDYAEQVFTYNWKGLPTQVAYKDIYGEVQESYIVSFNNQDKIISEVTTEYYQDSPATTTKTYTYDWLGRLTQETNNEVSASYTYDNVANRLTMTSGNAVYTYSYNAKDQLTSIGKDGEIKNGYVYDLSGNQIRSTIDGTVRNYAFSAANELMRVTNEDETIISSYSYDAVGQRLRKTVGDTDTKYVYDSLNLIASLVNNSIFEYNYLEEDGSIICGTRGAETEKYWYRQDIRGSITNILNSSDAVVRSYTYDAYGNTSSEGTLTNSFAYTGAVIDEETGLYYMNARYYDPETGRFISQDSYRGENESFWHLYVYCNGDPVNSVDPTGHAVANIVGGIIGGVIGALLGYIIADALKLSGWKRWGLIAAITVAGVVLGAIIGPYIAKASKSIIRLINSGIRKASNAAIKAASRVKNFTVSAKHLPKAGGRYAKFATNSQSEIRSWISQALKSKRASFYPNKSGSYYIITNMGKTIGTKGERCIKVVFDTAGRIWTAFPVKK